MIIFLIQCTSITLSEQKKCLPILNKALENFIDWGYNKFNKEPILSSLGIKKFIHHGDTTFALGCEAPVTTKHLPIPEVRVDYDFPTLFLIVLHWDEELLQYRLRGKYPLTRELEVFDSMCEPSIELTDLYLKVNFRSKIFGDVPINAIKIAEQIEIPLEQIIDHKVSLGKTTFIEYKLKKGYQIDKEILKDLLYTRLNMLIKTKDSIVIEQIDNKLNIQFEFGINLVEEKDRDKISLSRWFLERKIGKEVPTDGQFFRIKYFSIMNEVIVEHQNETVSKTTSSRIDESIKSYTTIVREALFLKVITKTINLKAD